MDDLRPGDPRRIGVYRLLGRLGAGGMGLVYLGRSPGGLMVAVKVVHEHLARDAEFRARFRREAGAVRAVSGAFTAPVVDADPEAEPPWLATAYLPGLPLADAIERFGPLPVPTVLALGAGLAEALVSVHRAGVVHRDLKPANVMLGLDGPRVIDFGIAHTADAATVTGTGFALGSPGFIAPEQARGEATGPAADVFSLGAVLVAAATGEGPYGQGPPHVLIYRAVHEAPRLDGVTDPGLRALVTACLAPEPGARPTPAQVLEQLAPLVPQLNGVGWLPETVADAITQAATQPSPEVVNSRRGLLVLAGAGSVTAVTAAVAGVLLWPSERPAAAPVRPAARPVSSAPPQPVTVSKPLWRRNTGEEYLMSSPVVSGSTVFVGGEKGRLLAVDVASGRPRWTYSAGSPIREGIAVASGVVYAGAFDGAIHALDARTGRLRWRGQTGGKGGRNLFVAGGLVYGGDEPLSALDAATGAVRWSTPSGGRILVAGGAVYAYRNQALVALDASTGRVRWTYRMSEGMGRPAMAGGVVYCGDFQGDRLHAIDARTGKRRWVYDLGGAILARPLVANGTLYVGDYNANLFALDAAKGTLRWQFQTDGEIHYGAVLSGGLVYVTAGIYTTGNLYAVDAATGRLVWRFATPKGLEAMPAVGAGKVFAACKDGYLYALGVN